MPNQTILKTHFGIFFGVTENTLNQTCAPALPINFVPEEWKEELIKHGAKE